MNRNPNDNSLWSRFWGSIPGLALLCAGILFLIFTFVPNEIDYAPRGCTSDCSGHEAGYEHAKSNDICDTEYTNGNSNSFDEGVQQYVEDNCT